MSKLIIIFTLGLILQLSAFGQSTIDLSGKWQVRLDSENEMIKKYQGTCKLEGSIQLPASLAEKGYGVPTKGSRYGILTPEFEYIGKAWYQREIIIPEAWEDATVQLKLERVLWESRVFIDNIEVSRQDALGTPHHHNLGALTPGRHLLSIQVDNDMIHNIGDKGHAYGDYTQSIWNGIVGEIQLTAFKKVHLKSIKTFPDISGDKLKIQLEKWSVKAGNANLQYTITNLQSGKVALIGEKKVKIKEGNEHLTLEIPANGKLKQWSEFNPQVYALQVSLSHKKDSDIRTTEFGFCKISHDGTKLLINGQPVFLRGNLDCVHFPLTGYPSCKLEDWIKIFETYKAYGLNHARFHSWCPPEAAFRAANRVGIYLQAEASIWIDWWMSTDMVVRGRPEMDTKGHPKGLGHDAVRDSFVVKEMFRMMDEYGNHPSFTMFCIGNELGNSDFEVMGKWIKDLKTYDPRRLYAASTARTINSTDDYCATHYIQGKGRTRGLNGARTNWNFEKVYAQSNIPIIAHEIGQWPVYPQWTEINKYSGVLKARNFEEFKLQAEKNGIAEQDKQFALASGALNQIMYKYETESFLRTPSCAGVQLLSIQDYQGQGEALIGWLDAHWESKGITSPKKFREHFTTTVPLLEMEKFIWQNNETFNAKALLSHHGENSLNKTCSWTIRDENDILLKKGSFSKLEAKPGDVKNLGDITFSLKKISHATMLNIELKIEDTPFKNSWNIWVYPTENDYSIKDILIKNELNDETLEALKAGKKVLLLAHELGSEKSAVNAHYYPLYWSLTFFPGQGKTCIGLALQEEHPAFEHFPTSYHSDWQWESICNDAKGFILNDLPATYKPIAQPVDDFHRNNKVGSIFEFKIGQGKLLICGYNLNSDKPVAKQLRCSLINYMNSTDFNPPFEANQPWLKNLVIKIKEAETANLSDEAKDAILYVAAGKNLANNKEVKSWTQNADSVYVAEKCSYKVNCQHVVNKDDKAYWAGKQIKIETSCPDGILATMFVELQVDKSSSKQALLEFEGRQVKFQPTSASSQWVKFHVMREDSNDGKLIFNVDTKDNKPLKISKIILKKQ
ncbi:glycoside hydrolase family 2 [Puteibacter caeruleilacunae]|nr:glycoside hydrolase family 2 [Puteibacter caeruleilacunae]